MAIKMKFEKPEQFEICFSALALSQQQLPPSVWDLHIVCLRTLRKIGKPSAKLPNGTQMYTLDLENGLTFRETELDKVEFEHLLSCVEQPMWTAAAIEQVVEVRDWMRDLQREQAAGPTAVSASKLRVEA